MRFYQPAPPQPLEVLPSRTRVCCCSLPYEQCCGAWDRQVLELSGIAPATITTDRTNEEAMPPEKPTAGDDAKVNPKHYASWGEYAAIVIIRRWNKIHAAMGLEPVSFNLGNALKYMQRAGTKPGESEIVDLKKAVWYLQSRIHELDPANEPDPANVD